MRGQQGDRGRERETKLGIKRHRQRHDGRLKIKCWQRETGDIEIKWDHSKEESVGKEKEGYKAG